MASPEPKPSPWGVVAVENRLASRSMTCVHDGGMALGGRACDGPIVRDCAMDHVEGPRLRVVGRLIAGRSGRG